MSIENSRAGVKKDQNELRAEEVKLHKEHEPGLSLTDAEVSYPARYFDQYSANTKLHAYAEAAQLAKEVGLKQPVYSQELHEIINNRRKEVELAQFDTFIEHQFDVTDPTQLRLLEEMYPGFLGRKEAYIKERYALAERYELTKLRGPKNKDDLIFLYMIRNGSIAPPPSLIKQEKDKNKSDAMYKRGLANVSRWMYKDAHKLNVPFGLGAFPEKTQGKPLDMKHVNEAFQDVASPFKNI